MSVRICWEVSRRMVLLSVVEERNIRRFRQRRRETGTSRLLKIPETTHPRPLRLSFVPPSRITASYTAIIMPSAPGSHSPSEIFTILRNVVGR